MSLVTALPIMNDMIWAVATSVKVMVTINQYLRQDSVINYYNKENSKLLTLTVLNTICCCNYS